MPLVSEMLPSRDEESHLRRYTAIRNYVECLADYFAREFRIPEELLAGVASTDVFKRTQGGKCRDEAEVGRLLRHSWLTEIQLSSAPADSVVLRYTDHWLPMYLYYAVYLSSRAMLVARGSCVREAHQKTLRVLGNEIVVRPDLFPQPFRTHCRTNDRGEIALEGSPEGCDMGKLNPLKNVTADTFWSRYAMLLSTTHGIKVESAVRSWKEKTGRQRIPRGKRAEIAVATPPTTLFDFLYRLRIRANYQEVDSFLAAIRFPRGGGEFRTQLQSICWHCSLVLEFLTARYLGPRKLKDILAGFKRYDVGGIVDDLAEARLEVIAEVI